MFTSVLKNSDFIHREFLRISFPYSPKLFFGKDVADMFHLFGTILVIRSLVQQCDQHILWGFAGSIDVFVQRDHVVIKGAAILQLGFVVVRIGSLFPEKEFFFGKVFAGDMYIDSVCAWVDDGIGIRFIDSVKAPFIEHGCSSISEFDLGSKSERRRITAPGDRL